MPIVCPRNITVKEMSKNSVSWISHFSSEKSTAKKKKKKKNQVVVSSVNKMTYHPFHKSRVHVSLLKDKMPKYHKSLVLGRINAMTNFSYMVCFY